jgi:hypothetical protein
MNEIFAVHYDGELITSYSPHTRKGRIYTTIGPAKAFISRIQNHLRELGKDKESLKYTLVRYVPEEIKV